MEQNAPTIDELGEGKQICEFFDGKIINEDVLVEYCNKNGLEPISLQRYDELKYAYERDKRTAALFPLVIAHLAKLTPAPELSGKKERERLTAAKDALERDIAHEFETLAYEELDRVVGAIEGLLTGTLKHAEMYVSNMAAGQIAKAAAAKFGEPIMVGALANEERGGKPYDNGQKAEAVVEAPAAESVAAEPAPEASAA